MAQSTLQACRWCPVPPEVKAIRQNDPQFGDEWEIGCFNSDCPFQPRSAGFKSAIAAIAAWNGEVLPEGEAGSAAGGG